MLKKAKARNIFTTSIFNIKGKELRIYDFN